MAGSAFGSIFRITSWGESHGKAIGVVIDGCPAGLALCEDDIQVYLDRRKPGQSQYATPRRENDRVEILSGVFDGKTTGTPISLLVQNTNQHAADYSKLADVYRPGHADYTFDQKYGFRDYRGGGRSSGRETIARVAAGAVAAKILRTLGVTVTAYTAAIGDVAIDQNAFDLKLCKTNALYMPDAEAAKRAAALADEAIKNNDSIGGIAECIVKGAPAGLGEPCFDKLDANLAKAIMSIGAVKAVEIGDGVAVSKSTGSKNNDPITVQNGVYHKLSNHGGGIYGGISDGDDIIVRAHIKPTPSIAQPQQTISRSGKNTEITICGRHDPLIVPRAVVVVECMTALTVLDAMLAAIPSRMEHLQKIFGR